MALSCLEAWTGKNAGLASDGRPARTASQRSVTIAWNAAPCVQGLVGVCGSRPAPGATGSGPRCAGDGIGIGVTMGAIDSEVCLGDTGGPAVPDDVPQPARATRARPVAATVPP